MDSFLLASTVRGIASQRLVRKLCNSCKEKVPANDYNRNMLGLPEGAELYEARGCSECNNTGFTGRRPCLTGYSGSRVADSSGCRRVELEN